MKRKVSDSLKEWKYSPKRQPMIINGARQVGKTYIVEEFGKENYQSVLYLNMEIEYALGKFLETELSPKKNHSISRSNQRIRNRSRGNVNLF